MSSLVNLKMDLLRLLYEARWLINEGFVYHIEGNYTLKFYKGKTLITIYYGRYSDPTDVIIEIDSPFTERYENGKPVQYSVFESALVDPNISNLPTSDGFETAKKGLAILATHQKLFDINYLKKNRKKYLQLIKDQLPENLQNLT